MMAGNIFYTAVHQLPSSNRYETGLQLAMARLQDPDKLTLAYNIPASPVMVGSQTLYRTRVPGGVAVAFEIPREQLLEAWNPLLPFEKNMERLLAYDIAPYTVEKLDGSTLPLILRGSPDVKFTHILYNTGSALKDVSAQLPLIKKRLDGKFNTDLETIALSFDAA